MRDYIKEFPAGSLVRVKGQGSTLYEVDSWFQDEDDQRWYVYADSQYGSDDFYGEDLELVMTAEQASSRRIPTPREILKGLDILGSSWGDQFDLNESNIEDDNTLEVYGKTNDGLRFAFNIKVYNVTPSDF